MREVVPYQTSLAIPSGSCDGRYNAETLAFGNFSVRLNKQVLLDETSIDDAKKVDLPNSEGAIELRFTKAGGKTIGDVTAANLHRRLAFPSMDAF